MMLFVIFICAAAAFLTGFVIGSTSPDTGAERKNRVRPRDSEELERPRREYSNFLSYDGTKQE